MILLRTIWLGWSVPLMPIFHKLSFWDKFAFKQINSWGKDLCKIAKVKLHIFNSENINKDKNYLFASNHISPLDMAVISASLPVNHQYIANKQFMSFFVTKYWIKYNKGVFVDKEDKTQQVKSLKRIVDVLKTGHNLVIFPESNMSNDGTLKEFKRGGLAAAVMAGVGIIPIFIKGMREVCMPGSFSITKNQDVYIAFGKEIDTKSLSREDKKNINKIVYNEMIKLKSYIESKILDNDKLVLSL
jgi:1-acyl-sn-glycerol-3-phosphate acyltransferase